ncbi:UDP-glucose 4-epimerase family protein [Polaromonas glacialis]|uniref:UDP-glucose 4-epimerase family protein n=1 Tax=Polaromonas glacialis TaxID=866564 RepID=UPI00049726D7|nr:SDR family oxidoreductase [Polaromonas glacialis]
MNKVLVTGATGFVGRGVLERLSWGEFLTTAAVRYEGIEASPVLKTFRIKGLQSDTDWSCALSGQDTVVHCAARVHVMNENAPDPLVAFREVNFHGTLNLARQAAAAGVHRFVFISSIGVNGGETFQHPFSAEDVPMPHSPYAVSKYEAELALQALAAETGLEVVIIRPPLVYGAGAPGNFGSLMRWLQRGVPLPLGAIRNRRSLVALNNLADLIVTCITHPAAAGQTFLVSDGEDVSTTELLRRMGQAMGHPARLVPVPANWLTLAATVLGKRDMAQRLCGSLQVDIQKTRHLLGWQPPITLDQGLKKTVEGLAL